MLLPVRPSESAMLGRSESLYDVERVALDTTAPPLRKGSAGAWGWGHTTALRLAWLKNAQGQISHSAQLGSNACESHPYGEG